VHDVALGPSAVGRSLPPPSIGRRAILDQPEAPRDSRDLKDGNLDGGYSHLNGSCRINIQSSSFPDTRRTGAFDRRPSRLRVEAPDKARQAGQPAAAVLARDPFDLAHASLMRSDHGFDRVKQRLRCI